MLASPHRRALCARLISALAVFTLSGCAGHHVSLATEAPAKVATLSFNQEGYTKFFGYNRKLYGSIRRIENDAGEIVFRRGFFKEFNPSEAVSVDLDAGLYALYADCQTKNRSNSGHTVYKVAQWFNLKAGYELKLDCATYKTGEIRKGWSLFTGSYEHERRGVRLYQIDLLPMSSPETLSVEQSSSSAHVEKIENAKQGDVANDRFQTTFKEWFASLTNLNSYNLQRFYSQNYVSEPGSSLARWLAERKKEDKVGSAIRLNRGASRLVYSDDFTDAELSYVEYYRSSTVKEKKIKYLQWKNEGGRWVITREVVANAR